MDETVMKHRMPSRFIIVGKCVLSQVVGGDGGYTRVTLVDGNQNHWCFRIPSDMRAKHLVKGGWVYKITGHYRENMIPVVHSMRLEQDSLDMAKSHGEYTGFSNPITQLMDNSMKANKKENDNG